MITPINIRKTLKSKTLLWNSLNEAALALTTAAMLYFPSLQEHMGAFWFVAWMIVITGVNKYLRGVTNTSLEDK